MGRRSFELAPGKTMVKVRRVGAPLPEKITGSARSIVYSTT